MANWQQFMSPNGHPLCLNLDLAVRVMPNDDGTWIGFMKADGIDNVAVTERYEIVARLATPTRVPQ